MINEKELRKRLEKENIKVNIIGFEAAEEGVWFSFSFDKQHTTTECATGLDPHTEDDVWIDWLNDDDDECYREAVNQIKLSKLNPEPQRKD